MQGSDMKYIGIMALSLAMISNFSIFCMSIFEVAGSGNSTQLRRFLETTPRQDWPALVQQQDQFGLTLLHDAAIMGHQEVLLLLLTAGAGAVINFQANNGNTPLHNAAYKGHSSIAHVLIEAGADINKPNTMNITPLHYAVIKNHVDTVSLLLDEGAYTDLLDKHGYSPLYYAICKNNLNIIRLLLKAGAQITLPDIQAINSLDVFTYLRTYIKSKQKKACTIM